MSKVTINPLRDKVVVERDEAQSETSAGLVIPKAAQHKPVKGKVLACGPGTKDEKMILKKGDAVLYSKHAGSEIQLNGKTYLIMREQDIFAVIN